MKTYIAVLLNDGPDRERGTIVHVTQCGDTESPKLGTRMCPPFVGIIEVRDTAIKDLPSIFSEYGGHKSRAILDWGKLTVPSATELGTKKQVTATRTLAVSLFADKGTTWLQP